jgi:hypothetical protein
MHHLHPERNGPKSVRVTEFALQLQNKPRLLSTLSLTEPHSMANEHDKMQRIFKLSPIYLSLVPPPQKEVKYCFKNKGTKFFFSIVVRTKEI